VVVAAQVATKPDQRGVKARGAGIDPHRQGL
jgi:hypothetical protein